MTAVILRGKLLLKNLARLVWPEIPSKTQAIPLVVLIAAQLTSIQCKIW